TPPTRRERSGSTSRGAPGPTRCSRRRGSSGATCRGSSKGRRRAAASGTTWRARGGSPPAPPSPAAAVGAGAVRSGDAFLSLGTSGVLFVATDAFRPNPERAVHAFCHCLPATWHQMAVVLSAASCVAWLRRVTGAASEAELLGDEADAADA